MLIVALLLSLTALFHSADAHPSAAAPGAAPAHVLVEDVTARIPAVVTDPVRAARLVDLNRAMLTQETEVQTALTPLREKLIALYTDRLSTEADFATLTSQIDDLRSALIARLATERLAMHDLLSAGEWQALYGPAAAPTTTAGAAGK